jgi:TonB family protein
MILHAIPDPYRKHFWVDFDYVLRRTSTVAAGIGIAVLLVVLVAPYRAHTITEVEEVPERFARLILKEPAPPAAKLQAETRMEKPETAETPKAEAPPPPKPVRREKVTPLPADVGTAGREKAEKDITKALAGASTAVDDAIKNLSSSLGRSDAKEGTRPRSRRGKVSGGRSAGQLGAVTHAEAGSGANVDVAGSGVTGSILEIEALTPVSGGSGDGAEALDGEAGGGSSNPYRSTASLMAVVRRYAPGIQFCYDNELKRSPGIRGKMVAAITVAASGAVTDARVVSSTVGSSGLSECALAQIREWRFPAVPSGTTVFRAPFVFTPPKA